jgi:hypothetical protein
MDKEIFQVLSANLPQGETDLLLLLKVILQVNPRLKVGLDGSMITCRYENKIGYDIFRIPVCDFTDSDIDGAVTALLKTLHYAGPYRMFMVEVVKSWYTRQLTIDNDVPIRYLPHDVVSFLLNNETLTTTYPVMTERIRSMLQFLCN